MKKEEAFFCLNREEGSIKAKYLHTVVGLDKSTDDHRKNQDPPQNAFGHVHNVNYSSCLFPKNTCKKEGEKEFSRLIVNLVNELARSPKPQKKIRLGLDGAEKLTVLNERVVKIGREHRAKLNSTQYTCFYLVTISKLRGFEI